MLSIGAIKRLCAEYHFTPSKKFGQNYLLSFRPIGKMLAVLKIDKKDTVVEVGPGFGVLTEALAHHAGHVVSFEIEKKLMPYWEEKNKEYPNLKIVWGDFLHNQDKLPKGNYKVAANLPYQITSKIMRFFLESENPPTEMAVLVQKEVGERICAKDGKQSLLSLSVAYYAEPKIVANVAAKSFFPVPKVDSAVLYLKLKPGINREFSKKFFQVIHAGFSSPRKMLLKNLTAIAAKENLKAAFASAGIDEKIRPERVGLEEWRKLAEFIK